jgi:hypothetical protein
MVETVDPQISYSPFLRPVFEFITDLIRRERSPLNLSDSVARGGITKNLPHAFFFFSVIFFLT